MGTAVKKRKRKRWIYSVPAQEHRNVLMELITKIPKWPIESKEGR